MPEHSGPFSLRDLLKTTNNLNINTTITKKSLNNIKDSDLPCIYIDKKSNMYLLTEILKNGFKYYDENGKISSTLLNISSRSGQVISFSSKEIIKIKSMTQLWSYYKDLIYQAILILCTYNLIQLCLPLLIIGFYDWVIPTNSIKLLQSMTIAGVIIYVASHLLSSLKNSLLQYLESKIEFNIGNTIIDKLLTLPLQHTDLEDKNIISDQLNSFNELRKLASPSLISQILEIPFAIISIGILAILSGWISLIAITMGILTFVFYKLTANKLRYKVKEINIALNQLKEHQKQICSNIDLINETKSTSSIQKKSFIYIKKYLTAKYIYSNYTSKIECISDALFTFTGLAVISFGAISVIDGNMTVGTLLACMIITWKILSPLRNVTRISSSIQNIKVTISKLDAILSIPVDDETILESNFPSPATISIKNLGFKYKNTSNPVIFSLHTEIKQNQTLALTGPSGSGKTTLLKIIAGLHDTQIGEVLINDKNIKTLNKNELRKNIQYLSSEIDLLPTTLLENIAHIEQTSKIPYNIMDILRKTDPENLIKSLPNKLYTEIKDIEKLDIYNEIKIIIQLTNIFISKPKLVIIDDIHISSDSVKCEKLSELIMSIKGKTTVIIGTKNINLIALSDITLELNVNYSHQLIDTREFLKICSKEQNVS